MQFMSQKGQLFEAMVEMLEKDYGISIKKSDPASPFASSERMTERCQGLPIHEDRAAALLQA
ncbi:hypothetical protein SB11R_04740 [Pseudomonas oryzihabitans]|nr:hypothetical protein SB11R_04740 [Pseudomonas psychrotolerans]